MMGELTKYAGIRSWGSIQRRANKRGQPITHFTLCNTEKKDKNTARETDATRSNTAFMARAKQVLVLLKYINILLKYGVHDSFSLTFLDGLVRKLMRGFASL